MRILKGLAIVAATVIALDAAEPTATSRIQVPAAAGSGMYSLAAAADGRVYLSWIEPEARGHALKFSSLEQQQWTPAKTIARGDNWFVNWADHPTIAALPDGSLAAHWLVNNQGQTAGHAYGLRIAQSRDRGTTWREIFADGTDNVHGYSGFVTMLPGPGGVEAVYLTPPRPIAHDPADHQMTLSHVSLGADAGKRVAGVVDPDTCSCCNTAIVQTADGPVAAYRDHEAGEIRDISIVRQVGGRWTAPRPVHRDGWEINGCPTNGPAMAAAGRRVAVAWFTGAGGVPKLKLAFSDNSGEQFGAPIDIGGAKPIGWPAMVLLDDGAAAVTWVESTGNGQGELRLRRIAADGKPGPFHIVAQVAPGRSTGIPQMVRMGRELLIAWRSDRVESALVPIPAL